MMNLHELFGVPAPLASHAFREVRDGTRGQNPAVASLPAATPKRPHREARAVFTSGHQVLEMTRDQIAMTPPAERTTAMKAAYDELGVRAANQLRKCLTDPLAYGYLRGMQMPGVRDLYALSLHQDAEIDDQRPPLFMLTGKELREVAQHLRPQLVKTIREQTIQDSSGNKDGSDMGLSAAHNLGIIDSLCGIKPRNVVTIFTHRPR